MSDNIRTIFLDIIFTGEKYIKRYQHFFSGKMEIIEVLSNEYEYQTFIKNNNEKNKP